MTDVKEPEEQPETFEIKYRRIDKVNSTDQDENENNTFLDDEDEQEYPHFEEYHQENPH